MTCGVILMWLQMFSARALWGDSRFTFGTPLSSMNFWEFALRTSTLGRWNSMHEAKIPFGMRPLGRAVRGFFWFGCSIFLRRISRVNMTCPWATSQSLGSAHTCRRRYAPNLKRFPMPECIVSKPGAVLQCQNVMFLGPEEPSKARMLVCLSSEVPSTA